MGMITIDYSPEEAESLKAQLENAVKTLNTEDDGITLVMACGTVYGRDGYVFDDLLKKADKLMYEDKKLKKMQSRDKSLSTKS